MKKIIVILLGLAAGPVSMAGFAGSAVSSTSEDNSAGFYVNGNVGFGHFDADVTGAPASVTIDRNSFAWSANVGYQFNPYIAVEGGYMRLPYMKISSSNGSVKINTNAGILVAKGMYPISKQFDVFAKAGIAYLSQSVDVNVQGMNFFSSDSDSTRVTPVFGLGVDYNITEKLAITVQGITTLKSSSEFPATYTGLVGLTYKFS